MVNKKSPLIKLYSDSWKYLKSCKMQIYWIISLFLVFAIIGFFIPAPKEVMDVILGYIERILEQTKNMSMSQLISFIFSNNLQASLMGVIFGLFLGVIPIVLTALNGYILGFVAFLVVSQEGIFSLLNLFPHGIFELPAVFISLGLGLKLGTFIFQKNKKEFFIKNISESTKVFLLIVVPLLIIAAVIEGSLIFLMR